MVFWQRSCKLTLMNRLPNEEIRPQMVITANIVDIMEAETLKRFGQFVEWL